MQRHQILLLLAIGFAISASARAGHSPCDNQGIVPDHGAICVYMIGGKALFTSIHVDLDGDRLSKLTTREPWVLIDVGSGMHVVGIDANSTAIARLKVQVAAGELKYVRYNRVFESHVGFLDTTSRLMTSLTEVTAAEGSSELSRH
jgi:hypothetical protein